MYWDSRVSIYFIFIFSDQRICERNNLTFSLRLVFFFAYAYAPIRCNYCVMSDILLWGVFDKALSTSFSTIALMYIFTGSAAGAT